MLFTDSILKVTPSNVGNWRTLLVYNIYRLFIAVILLKIDFGLISLIYISFSAIALMSTLFKWPKIEINVPSQAVIDIILLIIFMYEMDGNSSSVSLLLVICIAAISLVSQGKFALFYASIATLGLLFNRTYRALSLESSFDDYSRPAMLSIACFAIAWLAHTLAKRMRQNELLATQRGVDLENLGQINALITKEMPQGVLVVDHHLTIKHYNEKAKILLNIDHKPWQDAWLERRISSTMPALAAKVLDWRKALQNGISTEVAYLKTDERELSLNFIATNSQVANFEKNKLNPISALLETKINNFNKLPGVVIFIEDHSLVQKKIQTQAQQIKLVALGRLTANIAHEIRNPLSAISHANQLLQEDADADANVDPRLSRMLQIIHNNVLRLDQIVNDVLQLNRRDRAQKEHISLNLFLTEFHTQFCEIQKVPGDAFLLRLPAISPLVNIDQRHLNQILWNLCKNGWRYCKKIPSSLQLNLKYDDVENKTVVIQIKDDGDGVPEEIRAHLFEPFFTTENAGTGLGLYISQELAEANDVNLQYNALPVGSEFSLHLKAIVN